MKKSQSLTVFIAAFAMITGACSSSSEDSPEEQVSVTADSEALAAAEAPSGDILGIVGNSYEDLESKILTEYEDEGNVQIARVGEPVSPTAGRAEVTWDLTGFGDSSFDGVRIIATVQTDLPGEDAFQITNAISQPICANGVGDGGVCL